MTDPYKAILECRVGQILRTPWVECPEIIDVGHVPDEVACSFCGLREVAAVQRRSDGLPRANNQPVLDNPDNHDRTCLWRMAKAYRS